MTVIIGKGQLPGNYKWTMENKCMTDWSS